MIESRRQRAVERTVAVVDATEGPRFTLACRGAVSNLGDNTPDGGHSATRHKSPRCEARLGESMTWISKRSSFCFLVTPCSGRQQEPLRPCDPYRKQDTPGGAYHHRVATR